MEHNTDQPKTPVSKPLKDNVVKEGYDELTRVVPEAQHYYTGVTKC